MSTVELCLVTSAFGDHTLIPKNFVLLREVVVQHRFCFTFVVAVQNHKSSFRPFIHCLSEMYAEIHASYKSRRLQTSSPPGDIHDCFLFLFIILSTLVG